MVVLELRDLKRPAVLGWLVFGYALACAFATGGVVAVGAFYCIGEACGGWGMPGTINWIGLPYWDSMLLIDGYLQHLLGLLPLAAMWIALCAFVGARGFQPFLLSTLLYASILSVSVLRSALWSGEVFPVCIALALYTASIVIAMRVFYVFGWMPAATLASKTRRR